MLPPQPHFFQYRKALIASLQASLIIAAYFCSFLLRFDFQIPAPERSVLIFTLLIVLGIKLPMFYCFGLLHGWWRYVGMNDLFDITKASLASALSFYLILPIFGRVNGYPRSVILIDLALTVLLVGGARFAVRAYNENVHRCAALKNVIIVGAGAAGTTLVQQLKRNPQLDYNPVGFVDDDPTKQGIKIHGTRVIGTTDDLDKLVARYGVEKLLLAIPSATGGQVQRIINKCHETTVEWKVMPAAAERLRAPASVRNQGIRAFRIEDLLGRDPVQLDYERIRQKIAGNSILITGGGGSIGSELARQAARFAPRKVILFERSESDLFRVHNELQAQYPGVESIAVIGDILDVARLRECFALHRPTMVLHAAAYKHVPMMESSCFQAITNNVFGTHNVALIARQYGVDTFVLISTDKAVNPTNIMGVSKRIGELIVRSMQNHTRFAAVRFGNVLGSNGSVVPIFQEQIARGGPVTVTHPEATRFLMTIPEAAQLVLQAASMCAHGGQIFVLKMGTPVRILGLAEQMIRLSGLKPGRDIKITFIGLRPGEKLTEELAARNEGTVPTQHELVNVVEATGAPSPQQVSMWLRELSAAIEANNISALVSILREIVPEYTPSDELLALCEFDRHDIALQHRRASAALGQWAVEPAA